MAAPTSWADWASTARDAASPMDTLFFETWAKRDRDLRNRLVPGPFLGGDHTFSAAATWEAADFGSIRLWVPKWARRLRVRFALAHHHTATDEDLGAGAISARATFDTLKGSEARVLLACKVDLGPPPTCDGPAAGADDTPELGAGVLYPKFSDLVLPESLRGVEADFSFDLMAADLTFTTKAELRNDPTSSSYPYFPAILFYDEGTEAD